MPRPSRLEGFLKSLPNDQRQKVEQDILRSTDSKSAFQFLKNQHRYSGSYDSVKHWRISRLHGRVENIQNQAVAISRTTARPLEDDPIASVLNLARKLNSLCEDLTALLENHQWAEPGETRLDSRQALKILTAIPALARASSGSILEMHRIRVEIDQKLLARNVLEELKKDWGDTLRHDNPELLNIIEPIISMTMARLEIDRVTVLEEIVDAG